MGDENDWKKASTEEKIEHKVRDLKTYLRFLSEKINLTHTH